MVSDQRCDELAEDLASCRAELALARRQQEELAEALARSESQRRQLRRRALALATTVDRSLTAAGTAHRLPRRLKRLAERTDPELDQVRLLRSSDLFDPAWYLLEHPDVAAAGLDPALHYLRHGVEGSLDPSPEFSTRGYLDTHPEVAASGVNPLLAHLTGADGPDDRATGGA